PMQPRASPPASATASPQTPGSSPGTDSPMPYRPPGCTTSHKHTSSQPTRHTPTTTSAEHVSEKSTSTELKPTTLDNTKTDPSPDSASAGKYHARMDN